MLCFCNLTLQSILEHLSWDLWDWMKKFQLIKVDQINCGWEVELIFWEKEKHFKKTVFWIFPRFKKKKQNKNKN